MDKARILADSNNKQSKPCQTTNCTAVGAYGIRPKCANYAMLWRRVAIWFEQWRTGRMPYAPTNNAKP